MKFDSVYYMKKSIFTSLKTVSWMIAYVSSYIRIRLRESIVYRKDVRASIIILFEIKLSSGQLYQYYDLYRSANIEATKAIFFWDYER
mmetsp:Transcript_11932/g.13575  ORF Transcript_11932/g.13575 Transcript_11932/m.13575 type:complete len:88 (+) Transcript_11932:625-888(+)